MISRFAILPQIILNSCFVKTICSILWTNEHKERTIHKRGNMGLEAKTSENFSQFAKFNVRKAAQVAAFFACAEGGKINVLKLAKLIYLADRKCLDEYDFPILYDRLVSMENGPANSKTLDLINAGDETPEGWSQFIGGREGVYVFAIKKFSAEDFDELSHAEIEILDTIWKELGHLDRFELRDYTHNHCLEWEDPGKSSATIPYERVFKFLNKEDNEELGKDVEIEREIFALVAQAK